MSADKYVRYVNPETGKEIFLKESDGVSTPSSAIHAPANPSIGAAAAAVASNDNPGGSGNNIPGDQTTNVPGGPGASPDGQSTPSVVVAAAATNVNPGGLGGNPVNAPANINSTAESSKADEEAAVLPSPDAVPEEKHPLVAQFEKCGAPKEAIDALTATKRPCNGWLKDVHWDVECDCSSSNVRTWLTMFLKKKLHSNCYASEDGPISAWHADADPNLEILVGPERVHAACSNSEVVRMVFRYNQVIIKMDTRESVNIPSGVTHLADFLKVAKASSRLALVFATTRDDVINVDPRLWTEFTSKTSLIAISGTMHPIELWRLIKCLKNPTYLNILNQKFLNNASLVDFARFLEPNIKHFMFDSRHTCNSSFIENVMALYGDLYMRQRGSRPCFKKLLLIVTDFCTRNAFETQLGRLREMLLDGEDSSATVLTTMPGDNALVDTLVIQGFKRGRGGYLQTLDHKYEKYDHWVSSSNGKTVVIGFRDPRVAPIPEDYGVPL